MDTAVTPKHVGLIPDGIRRWADRVGVPYREAYPRAMSTIETVTDYIFSKGVTALSVYVLSSDNLRRNQETVDAIIDAEIQFFSDLVPRLAHRWQCRVVQAGLSTRVPSEYASALQSVCVATGRHHARRMYLCAAYNPFDELSASSANGRVVDALEGLWVPEPIDMLIRTGDQMRLSNFLPLQSGYAELFFLPEMFPDVTTASLERCFEEFTRRSRRFGR